MSNKNSNCKWNVVAIAAAMASAASLVSAQDITMKATIPFAFSIDRDTHLAAGNYVVTRDRNVWWFRSESTLKKVQISNASGLEGQTGEEPSLTFNCLGTHCQLKAIRMGGSALGAEIPAPQLSKSELAELGAVNVSLKRFQDKHVQEK